MKTNSKKTAAAKKAAAVTTTTTNAAPVVAPVPSSVPVAAVSPVVETSPVSVPSGVVNILTAENFNFAPGVGRYAYDTPTGRAFIDMDKKTSNYTTGKLTVYDAVITWPDGTRETCALRTIGWYKKRFGAVINHRDGSNAAAVRVLSDDAITARVAAFDRDVTAGVDRIIKVVGRVVTDDDALAAVRAAVVAALPADMTTTYRAALIESNDAARAAADAAKKAAEERDKKAAARDLSKKILTADDYTKAIADAALAGDYARVVALTEEKLKALSIA